MLASDQYATSDMVAEPGFDHFWRNAVSRYWSVTLAKGNEALGAAGVAWPGSQILMLTEGSGYISDPFTFGLFHHELGHLKMYGHDNAVSGGTNAGDFIRQYLTDVTETDKYLYDYPNNPTEIYRTNVVGELDYKFVKNNAYKDKAVNSLYIPSMDTLYLFFHGVIKPLTLRTIMKVI